MPSWPTHTERIDAIERLHDLLLEHEIVANDGNEDGKYAHGTLKAFHERIQADGSGISSKDLEAFHHVLRHALVAKGTLVKQKILDSIEKCPV